MSGGITICYNGFLPKAEANRFDSIENANESLMCASFRQDGYCHDCIHTR
ncbi:MAG: hypothetical protein HFG59_11010 [Lachnospiraceae bacterium]|nr:hypothetical protein [Lachnospiraceae bacterium]